MLLRICEHLNDWLYEASVKDLDFEGPEWQALHDSMMDVLAIREKQVNDPTYISGLN